MLDILAVIPGKKKPYVKYYESIQDFRLSKEEVHEVKLPFFVYRDGIRLWGKLSFKYGKFYLSTYLGETIVAYEDLGFHTVYNSEHLKEFIEQNIEFDNVCWIDLINSCQIVDDYVLKTIRELKLCVKTGGKLNIIQRTTGRVQSSDHP